MARETDIATGCTVDAGNGTHTHGPCKPTMGDTMTAFFMAWLVFALAIGVTIATAKIWWLGFKILREAF